MLPLVTGGWIVKSTAPNGEFSDLDKDPLSKTASKMAVLAKAPELITAICADIAKLFGYDQR